MILISNDFWHTIKMYNFDPYNVLLVISINIAVLLMTASVLQIHILLNKLEQRRNAEKKRKRCFMNQKHEL